jgi:hypothetical protein
MFQPSRPSHAGLGVYAEPHLSSRRPNSANPPRGAPRSAFQLVAQPDVLDDRRRDHVALGIRQGLLLPAYLESEREPHVVA